MAKNADEVRAVVAEVRIVLENLGALLDAKSGLEAQVQDLQQQSKALVDQVALQAIRDEIARARDVERREAARSARA